MEIGNFTIRLFDEAENQEKDSFDVEKWVEKYIQKQGDVDVFKEIFVYKLGELNE